MAGPAENPGSDTGSEWYGEPMASTRMRSRPRHGLHDGSLTGAASVADVTPQPEHKYACPPQSSSGSDDEETASYKHEAAAAREKQGHKPEPAACEDEMARKVGACPWQRRLGGDETRTAASALTLRQSLRPLCLVTMLVFLWGFSYGLLDTLNKHFQTVFGIDRARSAGLQAAYFG